MKKHTKITTSNIPLLDDLVHYLTRLCTESVLKIQSIADNNESEASAIAAYRYLCAVDDSAPFNLYSYSRNEMINAGVPTNVLDKALVNLSYVPEPARNILLRNKKEEIKLFYDEANPYYRTLNGTPIKTGDYIYLSEDMIPDSIQVPIGLPLHFYSEELIDLLEYHGVIDKVKKMYPNLEYLNYLGSKRISLYKARKAGNMSLLYIPTDIPVEITDRFVDKLNLNRTYIETVVYSEAYAFKSEYYDNFLCVLLLLLTTIDVISEMPDMINKNEIFDLKMVKLIFDNYDIDFFDEIPLQYQIAMVKNLHKLLKFKSTTRNIIDICSIFGFDNVKVFKYYLLKERKMKNGQYVTEYNKDFTGLDNEKCFDLKFVKVPLTHSITPYLNDPAHHIDYDEVTSRDTLWDGGLSHEYVKSKILELEFNHYYTKYLSVDVLNSITKLSFQMSYFYNILFSKKFNSKEGISLEIPAINSNKKFKLVDIICFLYGLGYRYRGVEDTIFFKRSQILTILGFNFEADLSKISSNPLVKKYTLSKLGVDKWKNPDEIVTIQQLIEVYVNNKKIHDHILYQMDHAQSKEEFDVYKLLYDSLMITDYNKEFYTLSDGTIAKTYTDYLKDRDPILYSLLLEVDDIKKESEKKIYISNLINGVINNLNDYIYSDELDHVFAIFPTASRESIRDYVKKVINFFKSYKIDLDQVNTILKFDDRLHCKVRILDDMYMIKHLYLIDKPEPDNGDNGGDKPPKPDEPIVIKPGGGGGDGTDKNKPDKPRGKGDGYKGEPGAISIYDKISVTSLFESIDKITVTDFVHILSLVIHNLLFEDDMGIKFDRFDKFDVDISLKDFNSIDDGIKYIVDFIANSEFNIYDKIHMLSKVTRIEDVRIQDKAVVVTIDIENLYFKEEDLVLDKVKLYPSHYILSRIIVDDEVIIKEI